MLTRLSVWVLFGVLVALAAEAGPLHRLHQQIEGGSRWRSKYTNITEVCPSVAAWPDKPERIARCSRKLGLKVLANTSGYFPASFFMASYGQRSYSGYGETGDLTADGAVDLAKFLELFRPEKRRLEFTPTRDDLYTIVQNSTIANGWCPDGTLNADPGEVNTDILPEDVPTTGTSKPCKNPPRAPMCSGGTRDGKWAPCVTFNDNGTPNNLGDDSCTGGDSYCPGGGTVALVDFDYSWIWTIPESEHATARARWAEFLLTAGTDIDWLCPGHPFLNQHLGSGGVDDTLASKVPAAAGCVEGDLDPTSWGYWADNGGIVGGKAARKPIYYGTGNPTKCSFKAFAYNTYESPPRIDVSSSNTTYTPVTFSADQWNGFDIWFNPDTFSSWSKLSIVDTVVDSNTARLQIDASHGVGIKQICIQTAGVDPPRTFNVSGVVANMTIPAYRAWTNAVRLQATYDTYALHGISFDHPMTQAFTNKPGYWHVLAPPQTAHEVTNCPPGSNAFSGFAWDFTAGAGLQGTCNMAGPLVPSPYEPLEYCAAHCALQNEFLDAIEETNIWTDVIFTEVGAPGTYWRVGTSTNFGHCACASAAKRTNAAGRPYWQGGRQAFIAVE